MFLCYPVKCYLHQYPTSRKLWNPKGDVCCRLTRRLYHSYSSPNRWLHQNSYPSRFPFHLNRSTSTISNIDSHQNNSFPTKSNSGKIWKRMARMKNSACAKIALMLGKCDLSGVDVGQNLGAQTEKGLSGSKQRNTTDGMVCSLNLLIVEVED